MSLLDHSRIAPSVMKLLQHPCDDIARQAAEVLSGWREKALQVEMLVRQALKPEGAGE
jgi:hypothetical protein